MSFSLCRYRGQKTRYAEAILGHIGLQPNEDLWDVCAGSGAVAVAAALGGVPASRITMIERGPWGLFWSSIADGSFSLERYKRWLSLMPTDQNAVSGWLSELYQKRCSSEDAPHVFFLLQAASVHGSGFGFVTSADRKTVGWVGSYTPAKYFVPTETSVRRYPTRVLPKHEELLRRVELVCKLLRGATVLHGDVTRMPAPRGASVLYIDPPYPNTKGYAGQSDADFGKIQEWARIARSRGCRVFVSGYEAWSDSKERWVVGSSRMGGAGKAKPQRHELLMRL